MATAVAGGAAAPGAERGREPAWRRDPAGAAGGGAGGRRLGPGHRPRAVWLRGCPGRAPASASRPRRAAPRGPHGGGGERGWTRDPGPGPPPRQPREHPARLDPAAAP